MHRNDGTGAGNHRNCEVLGRCHHANGGDVARRNSLYDVPLAPTGHAPRARVRVSARLIWPTRQMEEDDNNDEAAAAAPVAYYYTSSGRHQRSVHAGAASRPLDHGRSPRGRATLARGPRQVVSRRTARRSVRRAQRAQAAAGAGPTKAKNGTISTRPPSSAVA